MVTILPEPIKKKSHAIYGIIVNCEIPCDLTRYTLANKKKATKMEIEHFILTISDG